MEGIQINWDDILDKLDSWDESVTQKMYNYGTIKALEMEAYAKENAPWEDQTGEARRSIKGETRWKNSDVLEMSISGNKEYSQYLEYKQDGKYAILKPTVDKLSPAILKGLKVD
ncbi:HK97 gp10 family phage protein [Clostridium botulinum]|uniref:HK97 gp10 family phage protein n=1 Tax=Clostridium botulinum TaxID=1491 RepID=UPI001E31310C|nr:HK97 gp10 family phage protein [Clostridium botulinum]MCD3254383.1 HK97 gp10 family phage protein [Clostridium botulinum C/D]MCD3279883.1 HK97 gp10 family phage protein [Clostridium botulinum C/D]MCD3339614.1 HK97 gp10 family phage protein [Clostridium botulinum C/D]MCD3357522.1 HK97 gp10 family phage protein [Clostridium botulinum C/D]